MTTTRTKTGRPSRLAEIQIAEYNTLTSRITYYVTMQYAAWGIAAGLFGYLASLWWTVHSHQSLEWIGVLCLLAVSWAVLHINFEFLVIVLYLKEELLPHMGFLSVEELDKALGFERFLRKLGTIESLHRDHATSLPFIVGPAVLLILLWGDVSHGHWSYSDTWWAVLSGSLLLIICVKVWRLEVLKRRLNRPNHALSTEEVGA